MKALRIARQSLLTLGLSLIAASVFAQAQPAQSGFEPEVGQDGKDVIWVPSPQALVDRMLDMAKATPRDFVIDLGSGDGRTVITAAKRGIRALGIEYDPDMVELSKRNAAREGVSDKASFIKADLFETDFSKATVITLFLLPEINVKLRPKILDLKPGTRIVSNTFDMGQWKADQTVSAGTDCEEYCTAFLWIVPAKAEGVWRMAQGDLTLTQEFQKVYGAIKSGTKRTLLSNTKLNGDQITFIAGGAHYTGRISGSIMEGSVRTGSKTAKWSATRDGTMAVK